MLKRLEKYEVVGEIGHGGMATVYRARDTRLDRAVALKVMHPHLQGAKEARQRFAREALTVARLRHPSILEIYDYSGEESETSFIATELLSGPTLKTFVEQHPDIPAEIAACITLQVARALGAAHAEGVVHRDVKPENVMLHENRCVKLTDFGIAQLVDVQSMTTTGQVLGSPAHMAPEQIEGRDCDPRSDLFSLGTVLYLLATGELPFTGNNPHHLLKRIIEGRFADPQQVRPAIGGKLAAIIRRLLQVDPLARYQDAGELERDLLAFVGDMGIESPDATLAEYLADPAAFSARFREASIARLTQLGEEAQGRGELPVAHDYYNRVLALDEGNSRVLAAVQGLGRKSARRRALKNGAYAAAVVGVLVVGVYVVRGAGSSARQRVAAAERASPTKRAEPSTPASSPSRGSTVVKADATKRAAPSKPRPPRPVVPSGPRRVNFNPFPANIAIGVNGAEPRPFGPAFRDVELLPGVHRFRFVGAHDCCIDEEVDIEVPAGDGPYIVARRLRFRPAGLYVVTDTPANVLVDEGRISGRSRSVIEIPDLNNVVETHRIRVTADGHDDHQEDVRVQAGQVVTVQVAMKPSGEGT